MTCWSQCPTVHPETTLFRCAKSTARPHSTVMTESSKNGANCNNVVSYEFIWKRSTIFSWMRTVLWGLGLRLGLDLVAGWLAVKCSIYTTCRCHCHSFARLSTYTPGIPHLPASEMTYIVSGGALNSTHSLGHSPLLVHPPGRVSRTLSATRTPPKALVTMRCKNLRTHIDIAIDIGISSRWPTCSVSGGGILTRKQWPVISELLTNWRLGWSVVFTVSTGTCQQTTNQRHRRRYVPAPENDVNNRTITLHAQLWYWDWILWCDTCRVIRRFVNS